MGRFGTLGRKKWTDTHIGHDGTASLTGGPAPSLDGQSLQIPDDDDISSLNTDLYGGPSPAKPPPSRYNSGAVPSTLGYGTDAEDEKENKKGGGGFCACCIPAWVSEASGLLKAVIALSAIILLASIIMVVVALALNGTDGGTSNSNRAPQTDDGIIVYSGPPTFSPAPSRRPTPLPTPTQPFTVKPSRQPTMKPSFNPTNVPSDVPTFSPTGTVVTARPTSRTPTFLPTLRPTARPTTLEAATRVTFYAMGGRFTGDDLDQLPTRLESLPVTNNKNFMVHLGDWNSPSAFGCRDDSFETNWDALYKASSVRVFAVVGDNEFNDCENPVGALNRFNQYCLNYYRKYWGAPPFTVTSQTDPSNWAFTLDEVLYIGIQLVGGDVHDEAEWNSRHTANLEYIDQQVNRNAAATRFTVIFSNAAPEQSDSVGTFYQNLSDRIFDSYKRTTVVIHKDNERNPRENWSVAQNYLQNEFFVKVLVTSVKWPPLKVDIELRGQTISFNQEEWL